MDRERLRPLLPAPANLREQPEINLDSSSSSRPQARLTTRVACNACRIRKSGCDGARPTCMQCDKRGVECVYISKDESETSSIALKRQRQEIEDKLNVLVQFVDDLRHKPDDDVRFMLRQLREEPARHPKRRVLSQDRVDDNVAAAASVREALSSRESPPTETAYIPVDPALEESTRKSSQTSVTTMQVRGRYDQQTQISSWMERLSLLRVAFWTDVPVTDAFAIHALAIYFTQDHPLVCMFHPDMFVEDLLKHSTNFCSRFLVNALLSYASQSVSAFDSTAMTYSFAFRKEAKMRWEIEEAQSDSATALAGLVTLHRTFLYHGDGASEEAAVYMRAITRLARKRRLFGTESSLRSEDLAALTHKEQIALTYCAWGAFGYLILHQTLHPTDLIDHAPSLPIPGSEVSTGDSTEVTLAVPLSDEVGHTFPSFCRLCTFISNIHCIYRRPATLEQLDETYVLDKYREFEDFIASLHSSMRYAHDMTPQVATFHVYRYGFIADLVRPFQSPEKPTSTTLTPSELRIERMWEKAFNELKDLLKHLVTKFQSSTYSVLWVMCPIHVANMTMRDRTDPEWRVHFQRCIDGCRGLRDAYQLSDAVAKSFLLMAVERQVLTVHEAAEMAEPFRKPRRAQPAVPDPKGDFMLDMDKGFLDDHAERVDKMAERFEELLVFEEFITDDDDQK